MASQRNSMKGWREVKMAGAITTPRNSREYKTGVWRSQTPEIDYEKCVKCLICWIYCPEPTILRHPEKGVEIDPDYCKGCGICVQVCPVKCITMRGM